MKIKELVKKLKGIEPNEMLYLQSVLSKDEKEIVSNCCGSKIHLTDICVQCGEHCSEWEI